MTKPQSPNGLFLSQGASAVKSGNYGQFVIEAGFQAYRVPAVRDDSAYHLPTFLPRTRRKILIRQHRIEKTGRTCDHLYVDFDGAIRVLIEEKRQECSGTTDEKLATTVRAAHRSGYPYFWLILSGDYFRPAVVQDTRDLIDELYGVNGRLIVDKGPFLRRAIEDLVLREQPHEKRNSRHTQHSGFFKGIRDRLPRLSDADLAGLQALIAEETQKRAP